MVPVKEVSTYVKMVIATALVTKQNALKPQARVQMIVAVTAYALETRSANTTEQYSTLEMKEDS